MISNTFSFQRFGSDKHVSQNNKRNMPCDRDAASDVKVNIMTTIGSRSLGKYIPFEDNISDKIQPCLVIERQTVELVYALTSDDLNSN